MIYAYAPPLQRFYAGAVFVTIAYIPDCTSLTESQILFRTPKDLEAAKTYLKAMGDQLETLVCLDYIVYPHEVNKLEYAEICRRKVNHGASRLLFDQKLKNPAVTLTSINLPAIKDFHCTINTEHPARLLLEVISYLKRQSLLENHYSRLLPNYNVAEDLGKLSLESIDRLLTGKVNSDFFILDSLRDIPRYILWELKNLNPKVLCKDYLAKTPDWWRVYFSESIIDPLTPEQQMLYQRLAKGHQEVLLQLPKPKEYQCLRNS